MALQRQPPRFTDAEDDSLLRGVSTYPALYDPRHEDFKNAKVKTDLWESISSAVGRDETCKRRWKDIKDNYFKIKRQHKMGKCRWTLVGKLNFLDNVEPERRVFMPSEVEEKEAGPSRDSRYERGKFILPAPEIVMSEQDYQEPSPSAENGPEESSSRKRRYDEVSGDEAQNSREAGDLLGHGSSWTQEDDVDLFMRSIAVQLKKLSPRQVAQAKVRILTAVNELQFGQLQVKEEPR